MSSLSREKDSNPMGPRLYHGSDMESYLQRHPTILYQYQVNSLGLLVMTSVALVAGVLAGYIWIVEDLSSLWPILALCLLAITALGFIVRIAYWYYFAKIYYLATSDRDLIMGKGTKVLAIDWRLLNNDSLDLIEMDWTASPKAVFTINLGKERYKLRLFNSYACLNNLQGFMSTLLQHLHESDSDPTSSEPGREEQPEEENDKSYLLH